MEILWWLAPPVVVTVLAMVWVSWFGREGRGAIARDEAVRRVGVALERDPGAAGRPRRADVPEAPGATNPSDGDARSRGVVVRRASAPSEPKAPAPEPVATPIELVPIEPDETVPRAS